MSGLRVVEVARGDERAVAAWVDVAVTAERHDLGDHAEYWSQAELLPLVGATEGLRQFRLFSGFLDGEVVAAGRMQLSLKDNLDLAELHVGVLPEVRRRGLGSALLTHIEAQARIAGRTRVEGFPSWLPDGPEDGAGTTGAEFARSHGFTLTLPDVQRQLHLPVPDDLLDALTREAAPHHAGYELRSWAGPIPEDLVVSWLELSTTLATEAPTGSGVHENEAVDVPAFRESEVLQAAQGRTMWHTVALDETRRVVAYTQLAETLPDNPFLFQWGTLVHRDHRGHRLGLAVKVANHRAIQAGSDVAGRRTVTWNAGVNDHMIAINERLGFVRGARGGEFQKQLD
ncbi:MULTISPECIES: GNAT family N-acetyltransferase [unclassified Nocardioides]|uniref:GNAT family N-acetyltransferase n=1 Tax=unclassified Nocardioides TaxID=2615069 RepID=UPI000B1047AE|nr:MULTISPECIES: GNAT family N-acetyltransferase [unclassified Nocardioides]